MRISKMIAKLVEIQHLHGDVPVCVHEDGTHASVMVEEVRVFGEDPKAQIVF